jgi:hypothetical protein
MLYIFRSVALQIRVSLPSTAKVFFAPITSIAQSNFCSYYQLLHKAFFAPIK